MSAHSNAVRQTRLPFRPCLCLLGGTGSPPLSADPPATNTKTPLFKPPPIDGVLNLRAALRESSFGNRSDSFTIQRFAPCGSQIVICGIRKQINLTWAPFTR
jgi:hypothetical protein